MGRGGKEQGRRKKRKQVDLVLGSLGYEKVVKEFGR